MHKKDQGKIGEAMIIAQALENGCAVFPEFGDNSRIDMIIEDQHKNLHRVQVKTVKREKHSPDVSKLYLYKNGPNYRFKYDSTMVDWFAVIDFSTKRIAWIKASSVLSEHSSQLTLRHGTTKNKQTENINMFDDYTTFPF